MRYAGRAHFGLIFAASAALASAAGAAGTKPIDIKVTAVHPGANIGADENISDFTFAIDHRRIFVTSPGTPETFDLTKESNGCLRGTVVLGRYGAPHLVTPDDDNVELRQICPVQGSSAGGAWMDQSSKLTFTARLVENGKRIVVESGGARGEFRLGNGAAADALRKRPELLAAAFAYGYVPSSDATSDGAVDAYQFVVDPGK